MTRHIDTHEMLVTVIRHALRHFLATHTTRQLKRYEPWLNRSVVQHALTLWPLQDPTRGEVQRLITETWALAQHSTITRAEYLVIEDVLADALGEPPNPDVAAPLAKVRGLLRQRENRLGG